MRQLDFPEGMKRKLGTYDKFPKDQVGDPDETLSDVDVISSLKTAPLSNLGTPVEAIPAPEKYSMPVTVQSDFQGSGLMSSGGVTTLPTFGTAGLTMFPGVTPVAPPAKYTEPILGSGKIYDRRRRLIESLSN